MVSCAVASCKNTSGKISKNKDGITFHRVCEAYAASHGLVYNEKKTECMVFGANGKYPETSPPILLNGVTLNRVKQFKYLGHFLTEGLNDDVDIERERRALAVRGNMLARRFAPCTDEVKITLFKAYCQSMYTSFLWLKYTKASLNTLRIQYNNIFRVLLNLPRYCSASGMFTENRTDGFCAIRRKKIASIVRRVRDSENSILKVEADDPHAPVLGGLRRMMNMTEDHSRSMFGRPPDISGRFPRDVERRRQWEVAVNREEEWASTASSAVCSEHFQAADFYLTDSGLRRLSCNAVPVINISACQAPEPTIAKLQPIDIKSTDTEEVIQLKYKVRRLEVIAENRKRRLSLIWQRKRRLRRQVERLKTLVKHLVRFRKDKEAGS